VGFNSGPAGAAYWGCKLLYEEGWEWVLWVDDDDPPVLPTLIEEFFKLYSSYAEPQKIGIIGAAGVRFDSNKAKTVRIKQEDLQGIQEVDNIAGNQFPLIHRRVFERGIFPDPKLFFGFEELEFNLRVKENGFRIVIEAEILRELRAYWQTHQKQNKLYVPKNKSRLWREYFSTRNMVYILKSISNNKSGLILFALRSLLKSMIGFRYGIGYGLANASTILKGLRHGFSGRLGPL
jgi:GT2 family glycosyltransferase